MTKASPPRPPRPGQVDPEEAAFAAKALAMARHEIIAVTKEPSGAGWMVTTHDGQVSLVNNEGRYAGLYRPTAEHTGALPWTLEDLESEAARLGTAVLSLPVDANPVRAWSRWQQMAASREMSMAQAAILISECAEMRRIILASDWLDPTEAAKL